MNLKLFFGDNTKIRFSEEGFKQTMETAKEIIRLAVLENQTYKITNDLNAKDDENDEKWKF